MQKRRRRAHGIKTKKISISVTLEDLQVITARALEAHGGNLSAVVHEMARELKRVQAMDRFIAKYGGPAPTAEEMEKLHQELYGAPVSRPRKRTAA